MSVDNFLFPLFAVSSSPWAIGICRPQGAIGAVCVVPHMTCHDMVVSAKLGVTLWHFVEPLLWQLLGSHGGMCCGHLVASTTVRTFRWCTAYGALRAATSSLVQKLYSRRIDEPEGIRSLHLARASLSRPSLRHDSGDSYFWVL